MEKLYSRWMLAWESRLCSRATDRVVRPFDWGLEWAKGWPCTERFPRNGHDPEAYLRLLNHAALEASQEFFDYETPSDFHLDGNLLRFTSAVGTPYPENNRVHAQWFPGATEKESQASSSGGTAALERLGPAAQRAVRGPGPARHFSALRLSLPYHDYRMPAELKRADYAVSSNVGRTIDATRQAW